MRDLARTLHTLKTYPGYVVMRSLARIAWLRSAVVRAQTLTRGSLADYMRSVEMHPSKFFPSIDPVAFAANVERDGYALGLKLPAETVSGLLEFARTTPCWADRNPEHGFMPQNLDEARRKLGRNFLLAQYLNARKRSHIIAELAQDPTLVGIAARYLGTVPKLVGVNMWWSYPARASAAERSDAAQMFHFDLDDFKFIKFFFYLSDVDAEAGPHVIVRGSHRNKRHASLAEALTVRRYTDEEIATKYTSQEIVTITGGAGTGFAEDTLCIHKGETPTIRPRLLLQLQYALNDFGIQHDNVSDSALAMIA